MKPVKAGATFTRSSLDSQSLFTNPVISPTASSKGGMAAGGSLLMAHYSLRNP